MTSIGNDMVLNTLQQRVAFAQQMGDESLLIRTLCGSERKWLRENNYKHQSVEPTHCIVYVDSNSQ